MSQSSKGQKESTIVNLDSFEFDPTMLDLKWSKNLISVLDSYRIHRCYDLTFIEKAVGRGDLPKGFTRQWTTIRSVLHKYAAVGPDVPGVQGWMKQRQSVQFISLILLTIAFPLLMFAWIFRWESISWFTTPFAAVTIVLMLVAFLTSGYYNRKVAWAVFHHIEDNAGMFGNENKHLKKWVQALIWHLSRLMRKDQLKPRKNLVKFWNDDYDGIIVMKEPHGFRKSYVVKIGSEKD
jgi:hypothetical protein